MTASESAARGAAIELLGWKEGASKVEATQAIRECSSMGLAAAHEAVDECLSGKAVTVHTGTAEAARELASRLVQLRFVARVVPPGSPGKV